MTTELELASLADRVKALSGPDREVDLIIARGFGWHRKIKSEIGWYDAEGKKHIAFPAYTASLDAAMALIDDNTFFHISRFSDGAEAHVYPNRHVGDDYTAEAATPALALCAAALRARSIKGKE